MKLGTARVAMGNDGDLKSRTVSRARGRGGDTDLGVAQLDVIPTGLNLPAHAGAGCHGKSFRLYITDDLTRTCEPDL
jgi:hypothetical protein